MSVLVRLYIWPFRIRNFSLLAKKVTNSSPGNGHIKIILLGLVDFSRVITFSKSSSNVFWPHRNSLLFLLDPISVVDAPWECLSRGVETKVYSVKFKYRL